MLRKWNNLKSYYGRCKKRQRKSGQSADQQSTFDESWVHYNYLQFIDVNFQMDETKSNLPDNEFFEHEQPTQRDESFCSYEYLEGDDDSIYASNGKYQKHKLSLDFESLCKRNPLYCFICW